MGDLSTSVPEFRNGPQGATVPVPDVMAWEIRTEENVVKLPTRTFAANANSWGSQMEPSTIKKRGLTKKMLVRVSGSFTVAVGTGAVTVRDIWPHGLFREIVVRGNGAQIHRVNGWLLDGYIKRRHLNPDLTDLVVDEFAADLTPANGDYDYDFTYEIPLCYDYKTGAGTLFAESDQVEFQLEMQLATKTELFGLTGTADVTFTEAVTVEPTLIFWEAPQEVEGGINHLYLPDLSRIFQLQMRVHDLNQTGDQEFLAINTPGNLMAVDFAVRNSNANINIGAGGLDHVTWGYGANVRPRRYQPTEHLLWENARSLRGLLPYNIVTLDFDTENPRRDSTRPKTATEMGMTLGVPTGTALSSAKVYMLHEQLVSADNPIAA